MKVSFLQEIPDKLVLPTFGAPQSLCEPSLPLFIYLFFGLVTPKHGAAEGSFGGGGRRKGKGPEMAFLKCRAFGGSCLDGD